MRFDLADLSLFRHVVEAGSITHGAERAHLALAAASTRIRNMEEALGAPLLVRRRQGVAPTPAGRTLLQHARAILRQAERLREDLGAYAGGLAGQVKVLSNTNALTEFLPETLSSFLAAHPHVSVDLEERLSDEIVGLIAEGVARHRHRRRHGRRGGLVTYPFRSDRFVLVVAREHPLARRSRIALRGGAGARLRRPRPRERAAALPRRQGGEASAGRCGCACSCAASTRCAGWSRAMSGSASCRRPRRAGPPRPWRFNGDADRPVGDARPHHLRARLRRAAALCAPAGRAYARGVNRAVGRSKALQEMRGRSGDYCILGNRNPVALSPGRRHVTLL